MIEAASQPVKAKVLGYLLLFKSLYYYKSKRKYKKWIRLEEDKI